MSFYVFNKINALLRSKCSNSIYKYSTSLYTVGNSCTRSPLLYRIKEVLPRRTFMSYIYKITRSPSAQMLKVSDGIPDYYTLIYKTSMKKYLLLAQVFSTLTAAVVAISVTISSLKEYQEQSQEKIQGVFAPPKEKDFLFFSAGFILVYIMLQVMIARMPIRIYHHLPGKKYNFVFYGSLPFTKKTITCNLKEVVKLEQTESIIPWSDSRYQIINQRNIIMLETCFRKPADYNIMLGYQEIPEGYE